MNVLYLVPQPKRPERIAAYTFLDEEIQALATAGVRAFVLSSAVREDGWCGAVRLLSMDARSSLAERLAAGPFVLRAMRLSAPSLVRHPLIWYRSAWREYLAAEIVVTEKIDIIHSHFAWPGGSGGMLTRNATDRPLIASIRGTDILFDPRTSHGRRSMPTFDVAVRALLSGADRTHYFSTFMRDQALLLGAKPAATHVIRKGVDLGRFTVVADRASLKHEIGLEQRPMVLAVGGLLPNKGIHHIIAALSRLRIQHDFVFVVCGEGPERRTLEEQSAQLGLRERTKFMGRVNRDLIPKFFAACDVFTLASTLEAAGNVVLEAMASGRPVVCTAAGGPQEYVTDGETGFVVPVADVDALTSALDRLLGNPNLQNAMGRQGRRQAERQFSYERMVHDIITMYEEVLRVRRR